MNITFRNTLLVGGMLLASAIHSFAADNAKAAKMPGVQFFFLADKTLEAIEIGTKPPGELALEKEPWIGSENIEFYDVSTHCVYLKQAERVRWPKISLKGSPFMIVVDGKPACMGAIWSLISSFAPTSTFPIITEPLGAFKGTDLIGIEHGEIILNTPGFVDVLKRDGQYRGGISVSMDQVTKVDSSTNSILSYNYTIKNLDESPLYIIDPLKMGSDEFLRHQNGINYLLRMPAKHDVVARFNPIPNIKASTRSWGEIDPAWFIRIAPGDAIQREFTDPNFPMIPPGEYECVFSFGYPGYSHGMTGRTTKSERQLPDGRYWMGQIHAKAVLKSEGRNP